MKKHILILLIIPIIALSQSGISLSGTSQFQTGQSIMPMGTENFVPINYSERDNQVKLSIFRGRKMKIGTFAINATISYAINTIKYEGDVLDIADYEINQKILIPSFELWYIFFQRENTFIYTSIGGYGLLQNLNITQIDQEMGLYEYNNIIPFIRTGVQLSYGRFFINPFISFDLQGVQFNKFADIFDMNLKQQIKNYNIRSGLEFGIMF